MTWRAKRGSVNIGDSCGSVNGHGYLTIQLKGRRYQAHRIAFLYMMGVFPTNQIDHINGNKLDNRWVNLRPVTHRENGMNCPLRVNNKTGIPGVVWNKKAGKWQAQIKIFGANKYLGIYDDFFNACCARKLAETKNGFHKNHGRRIEE